MRAFVCCFVILFFLFFVCLFVCFVCSFVCVENSTGEGVTEEEMELNWNRFSRYLRQNPA